MTGNTTTTTTAATAPLPALDWPAVQSDPAARLIIADLFDEHGRHEEAWYLRAAGGRLPVVVVGVGAAARVELCLCHTEEFSRSDSCCWNCWDAYHEAMAADYGRRWEEEAALQEAERERNLHKCPECGFSTEPEVYRDGSDQVRIEWVCRSCVFDGVPF